MKDLNFFEPYIDKKEFKFNKILILYIILMISALSITAYGVYNQLLINSLKSDVSYRLEVTENPITVKKVNEIKELELEVNTFREEVEKIIALDATLEANDVIGENLLKQIKTKMPEDLFLTNFSVNNRDIQVSGIARDKYSIAELSKGLEEIESSESVFISNITAVEDYYKFILNLTLKEVNTDGKVDI